MQRGTGDAVLVGHDRRSSTTTSTSRATCWCCPVTRRCCGARRWRRSWPSTARLGRRRRCSPLGSPDPDGLRADQPRSQRQRRARRRARRRHRGRARDRRGEHVDLLLPPRPARSGAAAAQPREQPGRVLPHRCRVGAARRRAIRVGSLVIDDAVEVQGVNDRVQLAAGRGRAAGPHQPRLARGRRDDGRSEHRPTSTSPSSCRPTSRSSRARSSRARTIIGPGAEIGPSTRLVDTEVGAGAVVANTVARNAVDRAPTAVVGPFAVLDPGREVACGNCGPVAFYTAPRSDES